MGWAVAGGVLGLILMFGAYRWAVGWATTRSGGFSIPTIGTRPRRLAGVPEEAPAGARTPPAMEVLRHGGEPVVVETEDFGDTEERPIEATTTEYIEPNGDEHVEDEAHPDNPPVAQVEGAASGVEIAAIAHASDEQGEFVTISNNGPNPVSLEGWKLTDSGEKHSYTFPVIVLAPGSSVRVHMWAGEDTATDLYVGRRSHWWNNDGDTAYLYDAAGTLVHSMAGGEIES